MLKALMGANRNGVKEKGATSAVTSSNKWTNSGECAPRPLSKDGVRQSMLSGCLQCHFQLFVKEGEGGLVLELLGHRRLPQ